MNTATHAAIKIAETTDSEIIFFALVEPEKKRLTVNKVKKSIVQMPAMTRASAHPIPLRAYSSRS